MQGSETVSYTHLDVYKRQIIDLVANKLNHGGSIDMNKVNAIGTACGVNIMELASKLK